MFVFRTLEETFVASASCAQCNALLSVCWCERPKRKITPPSRALESSSLRGNAPNGSKANMHKQPLPSPGLDQSSLSLSDENLSSAIPLYHTGNVPMSGMGLLDSLEPTSAELEALAALDSFLDPSGCQNSFEDTIMANLNTKIEPEEEPFVAAIALELKAMIDEVPTSSLPFLTAGEVDKFLKMM